MKYIKFSEPSIRSEEIKNVVSTLKSGWLTTGERTRIFENKFHYF